ncbi:hypothetical protein WDU94_008114 [Cyamophila willieti]
MSGKTKCVENFSLNDRVFAKMKSYPIWPAKIIEILDNDKVKVFFYGTHDCAIVPLSNVTKYEKLKNNIPKTKLKSYPAAVKEIKQDVNNKLFSCEKIKKYQKNTNKKKDDLMKKTKAETEEKNTKKRKMVTNSISEKGAPSKKPKKNQIPVDFSIFTASELYLECNTPENIPVRMHISDVLTKDILSTLPDYSKDPVKWKTFVLCIVDFIRCKIIKGEPVPHEVQNNIDVIIQNKKSQVNIPSPTPSSKLNGMTATSTYTKEKTKTSSDSKVTRNSRKRSRSTEVIESLFKTKIIPAETKREVDEETDENYEKNERKSEKEDEKVEREKEDINIKEEKDNKQAGENKGVEEIQDKELQGKIETEENSEEKSETSGEDDLKQIENKSEDTTNVTTKEENKVITEESNSTEVKESTIDVMHVPEACVTTEQSSASSENIQRQSPLIQNKKLLAKYVNYFNKRKLKLDLNEINNLAKMLDSKQENNAECCQQKEREFSSEVRRDQESTDTDNNPQSNDRGEPKKLIDETIEEKQLGIDNERKNKIQTDLNETNNELPKKTVRRETNDVTTDLDTTDVTNSNILFSGTASCSYSDENHAEASKKNNGVNVNDTNTYLDKKETEISSNDIPNGSPDRHDTLNENEGSTHENINQNYHQIPQASQCVLGRNQVPNTLVVPNTSTKEASVFTDRNIKQILNVPHPNINHEWKPNDWDISPTIPRSIHGHFATHENATNYDGRRLIENTTRVTHIATTSNTTRNVKFETVASSTTNMNISYSLDRPTNDHDDRPVPNHHVGDFVHIFNGDTSNTEKPIHTKIVEDPSDIANTTCEVGNAPCDLTEPQLNDLVHELFQQEAQALLLHVRLMQSLSFNKNQQSACSESDLLSAVQILSDLYHMKLNQFVLLRNPQLVFTCRLIAKCSRDLVDKNNNTASSSLPPTPTTPTMDTKSLLDTSQSHYLDKTSHSSQGNFHSYDKTHYSSLNKSYSDKISHAQFHAKSLETTAIRFLQYVSRIFEFRSGENFYDQFQHELSKFYTKTKNMTWSDMIYLAEQCIGNSIW